MHDMALNKIKELIAENKYISNDIYEYAFFNRTRLTTKYCDFLSPDSKLYSSPLNPLFSFELESTNKYLLKSFELISLRDGVLPLLKFFRKNPAPLKIDPVVIVDECLSSLVPTVWRERVVLRKMVCINKNISLTQDKVIVFVSPEKKSTPLNIVKKELIKLKSIINKKSEILIFFSSVNRRGEEEARFDDSWKYKIFQLIMNELAGHNARVLDFAEYLTENISGGKYFFINPLSYYFTDSYLEHEVLQRGAMPLFESDVEIGTNPFLKLSTCHGFSLHQNFEAEHEMNNAMIEYISKNETIEKIEKDDYSSLTIAHDEFKSWASDVALALYFKKEGRSC